MPSFGRTSAQRAADRANRPHRYYIKTYKDAQTRQRMLWEDPEHTYFEYDEHFDRFRKRSFPCARTEGMAVCAGCDVPVDESITDKEERRKDLNWSIRARSSRYIFPVLNTNGYLDLYKVGYKFRELLKVKWENKGSLTAADCIVFKIGTEWNDTSYDWDYANDAQAVPAKYTEELRALYAECQDGFAATDGSDAQIAAAARWNEGNEALGIPNIGELLWDQYVENMGFYAIPNSNIPWTLEYQLEADAAGGTPESRAGAQNVADLKSQAMAGGAPSSTERYVPPEPRYDTPEHMQIQELCTILTHWGVKYPAAVDLPGLQALYAMYLPEHQNDAPATKTEEDQLRETLAGWNVPVPPTADLGALQTLYNMFAPTHNAAQQAPPQAPPAAQAPPQQPPAQAPPQQQAPSQAPPAQQAPPQQAPPAAQAPPQTQTPAGPAGDAGFVVAGFKNQPHTPDGHPDFPEWDTPVIRDWLSKAGEEFPPRAPRSQLLAQAKTKHFGF